MRYKVGMPESESPSSADIDPTIERGALQITQRLLEVVGDLQPIAAILRHRNLDLEASKLVPWGSHQELLRAAIGVVQQETARLERIVDEAPTVESLAEKAVQP